MHEITDKHYGELCDLLSGAAGLMQLLLFEPLTDKQKIYATQVSESLIRMRNILNGKIQKKHSDD